MLVAGHFTAYSDIVGHCCDAWNKLLVDQPWRIMSLGLREPQVLINAGRDGAD